MANILITPDCKDWAIAALTDSIIKHAKRFNFFNVAIHPRGIFEGVKEIKELLRSGIKFDLWHAQYWHSAKQALDVVSELKDVKKILSHHNHYALEKDNWNEFDALTAATNWAVDKLKSKHKKVIKIPYGIDLDEYSFLGDEYAKDAKTIGYIGRVIEHKNLDKICEAAKRNNYKVIGCGYIDKPDYWEKCKSYLNEGVLEFNGSWGRQGMMPQNFETEIYRQMSVFVMYSTGEVETGTLPLLEAMSRGIPVMATAQGMARDLIEDGTNGLIFNDENFEEKLKVLMTDAELREKIRWNAWQTIKGFSEANMAREYEKAYYEILWPGKKIVSVIIPTFNRAENLVEVLLSIEKQNYEAKEIIVCDDGSDDDTEKIVMEAKKRFTTNILYLKTGEKWEYGLAKARNCGAIEALGELLVFLDDRLALEKSDCLEKILTNCKERTWHWGGKIAKGNLSEKQTFVENFSWIRREDFINSGMFCERINLYGGMSQEIRERCKRQSFNFELIKGINAIALLDSPRRKKLNEIWRTKFLLKKMYA